MRTTGESNDQLSHVTAFHGSAHKLCQKIKKNGHRFVLDLVDGIP